MPLLSDETKLPRLHLVGSVLVVLAVTLTLAVFFSWQSAREQAASLDRIDQAISDQQRARLDAEMTSALGYLAFTRSRTDAILRRALMERVDSAVQMMEAIHTRESGRKPVAEVRRSILEALRPMRFFDGRGYYFVDGMDGRFLLLPTAPQFEGKDGINNRDDTGHFIMKGLIEAARQPAGEGFSRYRWYRPDQPTVMAEKLAYVRHFAPGDWLVGTGDYTYEWEELQKKEAMDRLRALQFGQSGRIGVMDLQGRLLHSPSEPALEGRPVADMPPYAQAVMARAKALAQDGGGFMAYPWPHPKTGQMAPKTALVRTFEPWGWVVLVTMFDDELRETIAQQRQLQAQGSQERNFQTTLAVLLALCLGVLSSWAFSLWLHRLIEGVRAERQKTEADLRIAATAFDAQEGIFVTDAEHHILRVNPSFTRITGFNAEEAVGQRPSLLSSGRHDAAFFKAMYEGLRTQGHWAGEIWNRRKNGEVFPEWLTITAVKSRAGEVTHYVSTLTDITQRKAAEDEIRNLAFFDPLTQLPNRRLLMDRLQQALTSAQRGGHRGAVMFIDLDNFKLINDTLGHDKGDELLQEVSKRLLALLREGDTVARLGGDEFVVMLEDLTPRSDEAAAHCRRLGEKILAEISKSYLLAGQTIMGSCSIGVTLFGEKPCTTDELMKQADLAMYKAKAEGRNALRFFDPAMQASVMAHMALDKDLRQAMAQQQLMLLYQPQFNLAGRMVGAEALIRWQHPERGMVSPAEFIPLAEDTGLIVPMGQWVLQTACEALAQWAGQAATAELFLSVNVSGRQLRQPDFVQQILSVLAATHAPAHRLKLELTESLLLDNKDDTIAKMSALKAHGVGFSLDDFGTGYSSLAYLKRLPLDQLKIDQSFVHDVATDDKDAAIVRTVVALAESLGLNVIAEGVETAEQRDGLATHGCLHYQGYLYGKPCALDELPVPMG
jgi:diguanylate cyclase (GGDEF)-like protein/PAS domain S-box-containing protein